MKIIKDIQQGSQEWRELRLGVATASNFSKVITSEGKISKTIKEYALELASDEFLIEPEESFTSGPMARGTELEDDARQAYSEENLVEVEQVTLIKSDCGNFGYSPDGLVNEIDEGQIEIKCKLKKGHFEQIIEGKLPSEHKAQVQGGLMISGRKWCDYVCYFPNLKEEGIVKKLIILRIYRDEEFIEQLKAGLTQLVEMKQGFLHQLKGEIAN